MTRTEVWTQSVPEPAVAEWLAQRAESEGWDGVLVVDSQNLTGDPYVGLAMMAKATERIGLGTGVTNPVTRHPAATASAIASVQEYSGGRAVLGIGRGDSALFHVGMEPAGVGVLERYLERLAGYLRGEEVDLDGKPSRLQWLARASQPKVPLEVAATGPKVIGAAARHADRIMFAVGADPERVRWGMDVARRAREEAGLEPDGVDYGAFVNVVPHPDIATAAELARGTVATIAHFSGMAGSTGEGQKPEDRQVFERLHESYDRPHHTMGRATHTAVIDDEFAQRFAVLGDPASCVRRLEEVRDAGINRFVLIGPSIDSDPDERRRATQLTVEEVLPALQKR